MENSTGSRVRRAWNAFLNKDPTPEPMQTGEGSYFRPDRVVFTKGTSRTLAASVYNRIAMDVAQITIEHVRLDQNGMFVDTINSGLNNCLNVEANLDQSSRAFIQDVVISMMDEGCIAIVPTEATSDPAVSGSFDINAMRTAKIIEWYPDRVKVSLYNELTGRKMERFYYKRNIAIIENPLYTVINEHNSTMQRLVRKLSLLDFTDEQTASGKLNLIIQLPYTIKSETRRQQAEQRRNDIQEQLTNNRYGIAYTDGTEHITQLNRSVENNLQAQIEYLTSMLYSQLGLTQSILDGTADEKVMTNYYSRTIEPIVAAIVDEMKRKFLTKTARSQHQSIVFFRNPFKLIPVTDLAELADKLTRNEIMTSNEVRQIIGLRVSSDPRADELRNKNISDPNGNSEPQMPQDEYAYLQDVKALDDTDAQLDELESMLHGDQLMHAYASPYYDPVKAHQYYEEHKQLKGKTSTATLNEKGKAAAKYVKKQIDDERDSKINSAKETRDSSIENESNSHKATMEQHLNQMNDSILSISKQIKEMQKSGKKFAAEGLRKQIEALRTQNTQKRAQLSKEYSAKVKGLNETYSNSASSFREEAKTKYEQELASIKADKQYVATKKRKRTS